MPSDSLTVLTSLDHPPAKTFRLEDGRLVESKSTHSTKFDYEKVPVGSLSDLVTALEAIPSDRQKVVIRGAPVEGLPTAGVRRFNAHFSPTARQWCMIDIDKVELPEDLSDVSANAREILLLATAYLPEEFREVKCWYQFSASMGIKGGKIRVHLWYWLERKVSDSEMEAWLGGYPVDTILFRQIQMHFTAKPIFLDDAVDPIPDRSGLFEAGGRIETVPVPNDLDQRATDKSSRQRHVRTGGYVEPQEIMRNEDGKAYEGREALMFSLSNEVMRELVQNNEADAITVEMITDRLWERFKEEAILSGDRWTKGRAEEKAEARFRELTEGTYSFTSRADSTTLMPTKEPYYQHDLVDAETGVARLESALNRFFDAVQLGDTPRQVIRITMGSGKTTKTIKKLRGFFADEQDRLVEVYVPRHDIAEEYVERLADLENADSTINARIIHVKPRTGGQTNADGTTQFPPTCDRPTYVRELEEKGIPVFPNACSEPNGTTCQFFSQCGYLSQFRDPMFAVNDGNVLRIYTHAHLGLPRNTFEDERRPDLVVVDEAFLTNLLDTNTTVSPELIRQHIRTDQAPTMGDTVVSKLRDRQPVLAALRENGITLNEFNRIDLSALRPALAFDEASNTAPRVGSAKDYNALMSVVQILKDEWQLPNRDQVERLVYDQNEGAVRVCWLNQHRIPDDTAALFLDATAHRELTEKLVGPVEQVSIDIEQRAVVTQVYDRTGSKTWWDDLPQSDRNAGRTVRTEVDDLVGVLNAWVEFGEIPLCVCHKGLADILIARSDLNENITVMNFGGLRGSNAAKEASVVFITGRNQPPTAAIDRQARAVFWDETVPLQHDDMDARLPLEARGYWQSEVNDHSQSGVSVPAFSDQRIEAMHQQVRETETVQAIARLRLVHSKYRKRVYLLGNLPVEIPVDRLVQFDELMPDRLEWELLETGDLPLTALGLVKMRPDLATNVDAARMMLKRSPVSNRTLLMKYLPEMARVMLVEAIFLAGDQRKTEHKHLFIPNSKSVQRGHAAWKCPDKVEIEAFLTGGWGEISDLEITDAISG